MTKTELTALGLTEEDVLNRLTDKLCERFTGEDEDYKSDFARKLEDAIKARVDKALDKVLTKEILPSVGKMVEGICFEETNRWGEKKGTKMTFTEYLVQRVDAYIREEVDYDGKVKDNNWNSSSFRAKGTRIQHMVDAHLRYNVEQAMVKAMQNATTSVAKGLKEACEIAINNIKVTVNTKVESQL